jgi:hypothetical protein
MTTKKIIAGLAIAAGLVLPGCGGKQQVVKAPIAHAVATPTATPVVDDALIDTAGNCLNVQGEQPQNACFKQIEQCGKLADEAERTCLHQIEICMSTVLRQFHCFGKPRHIRHQGDPIYSSHRVYQYVNGLYNDDFFNYCISKSKRLRSVHHGNFYCIRREVS